MRSASPRSVAVHYATCTALALSAVGAPFVPEAVLLYAGVQYLRSFLYGGRRWQAPARVPLHLGRRGYRDATTRERGAATWPVGVTAQAGQQVWLLREDLAQGCAHHGDDPEWQAQAAERLAFCACLNQSGAVIVEDPDGPSLSRRIAALSRPFGRDTELAVVDLGDALTSPLRISPGAITATLAGLGLSQPSLNLHRALAPVVAMIASRHGKDALDLYRVYLEPEALEILVQGQYEIDGETVEAGSASGEASGLLDALEALQRIPEEERDEARAALAPYARELAGTPGLSLTEGLDLDAILASRRLTCIRPTTPFTTALVVALCTEALAAREPAEANHCLVHVAARQSAAPAVARSFLSAAGQAGAIGSIAVSTGCDRRLLELAREHCRIRIEDKGGLGEGCAHLVSTVREGQFDLDISFFEMSMNADNSTEGVNA